MKDWHAVLIAVPDMPERIIDQIMANGGPPLHPNCRCFCNVTRVKTPIEESLAESTDDKDAHWITIDGTHIQISGTGKVLAGPKALEGKKVSDLGGKHHPESPAGKAAAKAAPKKEWSYADAKAKQAAALAKDAGKPIEKPAAKPPHHDKPATAETPPAKPAEHVEPSAASEKPAASSPPPKPDAGKATIRQRDVDAWIDKLNAQVEEKYPGQPWKPFDVQHFRTSDQLDGPKHTQADIHGYVQRVAEIAAQKFPQIDASFSRVKATAFDKIKPSVPAGPEKTFINDWAAYGDKKYEETRQLGNQWVDGLRDENTAAISRVYDDTQAKLKAAGVTSVVAFRGIKLPHDSQLAKDIRSGKIKEGESVKIAGTKFNSWSTDKWCANGFASPMRGEIAIVIERNIDAASIVTGERLHQGLQKGDGEVLAFNKGDATFRIQKVTHGY